MWHRFGERGALVFCAAALCTAIESESSAQPNLSAPSNLQRALPSANAPNALSFQAEAPKPRESVTTAAFLPTTFAQGRAQEKTDASDPEMLMMSTGLDALLVDTAQDLGLSVELAYRPPSRLPQLSEADLPALSQALGGFLIMPTLLPLQGQELEIRLVLADPRSRSLRLRVERTEREDIAVRAVVMLRDLVMESQASGDKAGPGLHSPPKLEDVGGGALVTPAKSAGRATLAVNATLWGGLLGYSIQRASGSSDPRLLYPLLAVGSGVGLGSAMIVAEEWDVGVGDAWYLVSGAWWPTIAAHLIYEGRFAKLPRYRVRSDERWSFGLVGSAFGIGLATLGLTLGDMSEGGALLAHSGGGLGFVFGGLSELFARGNLDRLPLAGMGYGAGLGWLACAAAATLTKARPSRVLATNLGAIVGGLGGAALASPLLFDDPTSPEARAWLGITAGSSLLGAGLAWYISRDRIPAHHSGDTVDSIASLAKLLPTPGMIGESVLGSRRAPALGLLFQGAIP